MAVMLSLSFIKLLFFLYAINVYINLLIVETYESRDWSRLCCGLNDFGVSFFLLSKTSELRDTSEEQEIPRHVS